MATPRFFRVKAVSGFHVLDVVSIATTHRTIGYDKKQVGERQLFGLREPQPEYEYVVSGRPDLVAETRDGHIRSAIIGGALDYVETVDGIGAKARIWREPELVRATTFNMIKRAKSAADSSLGDSALSAANDKALAEADAARADAFPAQATAEKSDAPADILPDEINTGTHTAAQPVTGV